MEDLILESIKYFSFFNYPPTKEETYCFLKKRVSFDRFLTIFKNKAKNSLKYTLPEYSKNIRLYEKRRVISQSKLNNWRFKFYIKFINFFPQIKLVGLSGSISMMNAVMDDDIDLFIITAKNKLFTGRFIALLFAQLLYLRRKRITNYELRINEKNKVCLNLFFDESNLTVPKFKQSEYVAHEVLQMKPIINKSQTYEKFLQANLWVIKIFPNSKLETRNPKQAQNSNFENLNLFRTSIFGFRILIGNWIETMLKKFQLRLINRHKTTEIITSNQLWFHPKDFGKNF